MELWIFLAAIYVVYLLFLKEKSIDPPSLLFQGPSKHRLKNGLLTSREKGGGCAKR
jgi:uncharacterized protein (UPF0305 family)